MASLAYASHLGFVATGTFSPQPIISSRYDWKSEQRSIPVNLMVSKLVRFDKQMVSFQGGIRYWVKSTDSGPEGLGLRFAVTLLFPK